MNIVLEGFPKALGDLLLWLVPIGVGFDYWGDETDIPRGYILAYGQDIFPQRYPKLYKKWTRGGTTHLYGAGSVAGTTKAPDKRGRASVGKDNMGGTAANRVTTGVSGVDGATLGAVGGDQRLTQHLHGAGSLQPVTSDGLGNISGHAPPDTVNNGVGASFFTSTVGMAGSTANAGGGGSENMPPVIVCNHIIRAG